MTREEFASSEDIRKLFFIGGLNPDALIDFLFSLHCRIEAIESIKASPNPFFVDVPGSESAR